MIKAVNRFPNALSSTFSAVGYVDGKPTLIFVLCMLMRCVSGTGGALLTVSSTSILLKAKSYSNATIFVSMIYIIHR